MSLRRKTVVTVISKIGDRKPKADACLVVIYGQALGQKYVLKPGEIVIGRSSQAQIQIDHESVSRRHARLVHSDGGVTLADMGSTNGTYVNDDPIEERPLQNGDLVKVGRSILKYLSTDNIESAYHEEIYRLATIDGLTRCFNARAAKEAIVREASRAKRYKRPLSLVVFDVDDFSRINEEFGHLAGDAVLAQLGKRLSRRIRREDVLARTGGGEFSLLAPEVGKEGAVILAERISKIVSESAFGFDDVQIPVTLSLGVADLQEVAEVDFESPTSPGDKPAMEPTTGTTNTSAAVDSMSTTGDPRDRFHGVADAFLNLARDRVGMAKEQGKGCVVS